MKGAGEQWHQNKYGEAGLLVVSIDGHMENRVESQMVFEIGEFKMSYSFLYIHAQHSMCSLKETSSCSPSTLIAKIKGISYSLWRNFI